MIHYALKIAYRGKPFSGSQRQPQVRTVEGDMIKALVAICAIEGADEADLRSAGRTDKGVSALGNVISYHSDMDPNKMFPALTANLKDIYPRAYAEVGPDFNPRKAKARTYRYHLQDQGHDLSKMNEAAALFAGYHDFTRFAKMEKDRDPMRRVHEVSVSKKGDHILIDVRGESFLWNMVRRMSSALSLVGLDECSVEDVTLALQNKGDVVFPPLHPHGLVLLDVEYGIKFKPLDVARGKLELSNILAGLSLEHKVTEELFSSL